MRAFFIRLSLFALAVLICTLVLEQYRRPFFGAGIAAPETSIDTCFVPDDDCTQFIVEAIGLAEREVLVQAYGFTNTDILAALGHAKEARKLSVRVLLDKSNEQPRYSGATYMHNRGVPVLIDASVAIAHNKVIIIDRKHVLTGSFNFTKAAQKRNAENVVLIRNAPALAARFAAYWDGRAALSRPYTPPR